MGKGGMMVVGAQQRGIMNEGLQTGKDMHGGDTCLLSPSVARRNGPM
jgi:hypothetical protein